MATETSRLSNGKVRIRKAGLRKLLRTLLPILFTVAAAILIELIFRQYLGSELEGVQLAVWEVFFSVFGVIYAVITGFLLFDILTSYNSLLYTMRDELNAIQDVRDFVLYIQEQSSVASRIRRNLTKYVDRIVEEEWDNMRQNHDPLKADTSPALYQVMHAVNEIKVRDQNDSIAVTHLMDIVANLTTFRTKRWEFASDILSPALKFLMMFLSVVLVVGFILFHVDNIWLDLFMVFAITVATHLVYQVIADLNTPFKGLWSIDKAPFEALRDKFLEENRLEDDKIETAAAQGEVSH